MRSWKSCAIDPDEGSFITVEILEEVTKGAHGGFIPRNFEIQSISMECSIPGLGLCPLASLRSGGSFRIRVPCIDGESNIGGFAQGHTKCRDMVTTTGPINVTASESEVRGALLDLDAVQNAVVVKESGPSRQTWVISFVGVIGELQDGMGDIVVEDNAAFISDVPSSVGAGGSLPTNLSVAGSIELDGDELVATARLGFAPNRSNDVPSAPCEALHRAGAGANVLNFTCAVANLDTLQRGAKFRLAGTPRSDNIYTVSSTREPSSNILYVQESIATQPIVEYGTIDIFSLGTTGAFMVTSDRNDGIEFSESVTGLESLGDGDQIRIRGHGIDGSYTVTSATSTSLI